MTEPIPATPDADVTAEAAVVEEVVVEEEVKEDDDIGEDDADEVETKKENRYQRLVRELQEKNKAIDALSESLEEVKKSIVNKPSEGQKEVEEEFAEWFKEAWGDDEVSKKTYKEMKGFIKKISRQAIDSYVEEVQKKQTDEMESIETTKGQFNKEFSALVDEGKDRFKLEQLLGHAKTMMEKRAVRLGVDFSELPVPDLALIYNDLDKLRPKVKRKDDVGALDKGSDGSGATKKTWSLKDLEKMRW